MKEETKGTFIVGYFTLLIIAAIVSGVINSNKIDKAEKALAERKKDFQEVNDIQKDIQEVSNDVQELNKEFLNHRHNGIGGKIK